MPLLKTYSTLITDHGLLLIVEDKFYRLLQGQLSAVLHPSSELVLTNNDENYSVHGIDTSWYDALKQNNAFYLCSYNQVRQPIKILLEPAMSLRKPEKHQMLERSKQGYATAHLSEQSPTTIGSIDLLSDYEKTSLSTSESIEHLKKTLNKNKKS